MGLMQGFEDMSYQRITFIKTDRTEPVQPDMHSGFYKPPTHPIQPIIGCLKKCSLSTGWWLHTSSAGLGSSLLLVALGKWVFPQAGKSLLNIF